MRSADFSILLFVAIIDVASFALNALPSRDRLALAVMRCLTGSERFPYDEVFDGGAGSAGGFARTRHAIDNA